MTDKLPAWAGQMRRLFRSDSTSQFILHGNVRDLVAADDGESTRYVALPDFLASVMFRPFDVVIRYDRGRGIRIVKGGPHFQRFLEAFDSFHGTDWAKLPANGSDQVLDLANVLPREAQRALELINRFVRGSQALTDAGDDGQRVPAPLKVAVIVEYAQFIAPRAEALQMSGERTQILIQLLDWASDPLITSAFVANVLVVENLAALHDSLVENPYSAKIAVELPTAPELAGYVAEIARQEPGFEELCGMAPETLAVRLAGLSRVGTRNLLLRAVRNGKPITHEYVSRTRKNLIEKEAAGLIKFIESERTLDDVAGHVEAKAWLRQDAALLRRNVTRAIPMGYLLAGRIGTGKTYLVTCLAGEIGVPVVEIRNFREKWIGSTEANLEKIFAILEALGQVIVFVDEADQATGKRGGGDGDSGLSGRIYGMLAKKMSDTRNRGKIVWAFATSRPDLLEVDLKRQGRLDVHIPLFPPHDAASRHDLFHAMARKVGLDIDKDELPSLPDNDQIGGNEMEGILVRALRLYETRGDEQAGSLADVITDVIADFRPSAHAELLLLMDLLAVKECTDERFLPPRYARMDSGEVNRRIDELRMRVSSR